MIKKEEFEAAISPILRYGQEAFNEWSRLTSDLLEMTKLSNETGSGIPAQVLADIVEASIKRMRVIVDKK